MACGVVRGVITKVPFSPLLQMEAKILSALTKKPGQGRAFCSLSGSRLPRTKDQWNCSSSVEPVSAVTLDLPPWITVVTSSK